MELSAVVQFHHRTTCEWSLHGNSTGSSVENGIKWMRALGRVTFFITGSPLVLMNRTKSNFLAPQTRKTLMNWEHSKDFRFPSRKLNCATSQAREIYLTSLVSENAAKSHAFRAHKFHRSKRIFLDSKAAHACTKLFIEFAFGDVWRRSSSNKSDADGSQAKLDSLVSPFCSETRTFRSDDRFPSPKVRFAHRFSRVYSCQLTRRGNCFRIQSTPIARA